MYNCFLEVSVFTIYKYTYPHTDIPTHSHTYTHNVYLQYTTVIIWKYLVIKSPTKNILTFY